MEWSDEGIVLSARRLGEGSLVVELLTREHGRAPGLIRGGGSGRLRGVLQCGNEVKAVWRARLSEHLGSYSCELLRNGVARWLDDPARLGAIRSACALAETTLAEREPHPVLYEGLVSLFESFASEAWPAVYVRWEVELLRELGYGLDLSSCAASGATSGLAYVSPRSGRAVSREAGAPYRDRLLPLPGFLAGGSLLREEMLAGLEMTGYFLGRHIFAPAGRALPPARSRLVAAFGRLSQQESHADR